MKWIIAGLMVALPLAGGFGRARAATPDSPWSAEFGDRLGQQHQRQHQLERDRPHQQPGGRDPEEQLRGRLRHRPAFPVRRRLHVRRRSRSAGHVHVPVARRRPDADGRHRHVESLRAVPGLSELRARLRAAAVRRTLKPGSAPTAKARSGSRSSTRPTSFLVAPGANLRATPPTSTTGRRRSPWAATSACCSRSSRTSGSSARLGLRWVSGMSGSTAWKARVSRPSTTRARAGRCRSWSACARGSRSSPARGPAYRLRSSAIRKNGQISTPLMSGGGTRVDASRRR